MKCKHTENCKEHKNRFAGCETLEYVKPCISSYSSTDLLALQVRNLIAAREFNTALANRELQSGDGWLGDHAAYDRELADEIEALLGKANRAIDGKKAKINIDKRP